MEINTLVRHKKRSSLGIGCVSKVMKKNLKINFGTDDCVTTSPDDVEAIDTSGCKTIPLAELRRMTFTNSVGNEKIILGNELKQWVGIGWVTVRVIKEEDLKSYRRVIQ